MSEPAAPSGTRSDLTDAARVDEDGRELPYLSVIVPAYQEAARIGRSLEQITTYLRQQPYRWEVVVVDDGSDDPTAAVAQAHAAAEPRVRVLSIPHAGKGWAVRTGMLAATGRFRHLTDADLSTPIQELEKFLPPALPDVDLAIGSRELKGAVREAEPWHRHLMGRVFNRLVRLVAVPSIQDTQCGFKCVRAAVAQTLFSRQRVRGFGFDVEILLMAQRLGLRVREVPVTWVYGGASRVRPLRDTVGMCMDLLRVRCNAWRGVYGPRHRSK